MSYRYKSDGMIFVFEGERDYLISIREYYEYRLEMIDCKQKNIMSFLDYVQDKRHLFNIENISNDPDFNTTFRQYYFGVDPGGPSETTTTTVAVPLTSWSSTSGPGFPTTFSNYDWMHLPYPIGYGIPVREKSSETGKSLSKEGKKNDECIKNRFELMDF